MPTEEYKSILESTLKNYGVVMEEYLKRFSPVPAYFNERMKSRRYRWYYKTWKIRRYFRNLVDALFGYEPEDG